MADYCVFYGIVFYKRNGIWVYKAYQNPSFPKDHRAPILRKNRHFVPIKTDIIDQVFYTFYIQTEKATPLEEWWITICEATDSQENQENRPQATSPFDEATTTKLSEGSKVYPEMAQEMKNYSVLGIPTNQDKHILYRIGGRYGNDVLLKTLIQHEGMYSITLHLKLEGSSAIVEVDPEMEVSYDDSQEPPNT